jgi:hypothetical protein
MLSLEALAPRVHREAREYPVRRVRQARQVRPALRQTPAQRDKLAQRDKPVLKCRTRVTSQDGSSLFRRRLLGTILTSMIHSVAHFLWIQARGVS